MTIKGKVHCFFEQSGTFKREFIKLGIPAEDYDIQNNFGETDHVMDLFAEIEKSYGGGYSIFDSISSDDLIMAFFPCVYFCKPSQLGFNYRNRNYRKLNMKEATDKILQRAQNREYYYSLLIKLFAIAYIKNIRMIVENPATEPHYLLYPCNFIYAPTFIDHNRRLRGDFFPKPTAYWFVGCEPTSGLSAFTPKEKKTILKAKQSLSAGVCSEERSIITPDYARNFICDFIIGKLQKYSQLSITDLTTETLNF